MTGTVGQDNDRGTVTDRNRKRVTGTVGQDNDRGTMTDRNRDRVTGTVGQEQRDQDGRKGKTELHRGKDRNWNRDRRTWTGTEGWKMESNRERGGRDRGIETGTGTATKSWTGIDTQCRNREMDRDSKTTTKS